MLETSPTSSFNSKGEKKAHTSFWAAWTGQDIPEEVAQHAEQIKKNLLNKFILPVMMIHTLSLLLLLFNYQTLIAAISGIIWNGSLTSKPFSFRIPFTKRIVASRSDGMDLLRWSVNFIILDPLTFINAKVGLGVFSINWALLTVLALIELRRFNQRLACIALSASVFLSMELMVFTQMNWQQITESCITLIAVTLFFVVVDHYVIASLAQIYIKEQKIKTAIEEKSKAGAIQRALIQSDTVFCASDSQKPLASITCIYNQAALAGGDWMRYHFSPTDNVLYLAICDVTGHDLLATMVSGIAGGIFLSLEDDLRQAAASGKSLKPQEVLTNLAAKINNAVVQVGADGKEALMTGILTAIELDSGVIHMINGGHPQPLVLSMPEDLAGVLPAAKEGSKSGWLSTAAAPQQVKAVANRSLGYRSLNSKADNPFGFSASHYTVTTQLLPKGTVSLLLHTDGMVELVSRGERSSEDGWQARRNGKKMMMREVAAQNNLSVVPLDNRPAPVVGSAVRACLDNRMTQLKETGGQLDDDVAVMVLDFPMAA